MFILIYTVISLFVGFLTWLADRKFAGINNDIYWPIVIFNAVLWPLAAAALTYMLCLDILDKIFPS